MAVLHSVFTSTYVPDATFHLSFSCSVESGGGWYSWVFALG